LQIPDPYQPGSLRLYLRRAWGEFAAGQWHTLPLAETNCYQAAIDDFAVAAQQGRPAPIDGHAARRVLAVVLAAYRSAVERRAIALET
jgi:predicted dehydrogenase